MYAYLIHREIYGKSSLSHYKFRETVVRILNEIHAPATGESVSDQANIDYSLVRMNSFSFCVYCKLANKGRHHTSRKCLQCSVALCFHERSCFEEWHSSKLKSQRIQYLTKSHPQVGRPKGSTKSKGLGKRRRKNWWHCFCHKCVYCIVENFNFHRSSRRCMWSYA